MTHTLESEQKSKAHQLINQVLFKWMVDNRGTPHTIHTLPASSGRQERQIIWMMDYLNSTEPYRGRLHTYDRTLLKEETGVPRNNFHHHFNGDIFDLIQVQNCDDEPRIHAVWYDLLCGLSDQVLEKFVNNVCLMKKGSLVFLTTILRKARNVRAGHKLHKLYSNNGPEVEVTETMDRLFLVNALINEELNLRGVMLKSTFLPYTYSRTNQTFTVLGYQVI